MLMGECGEMETKRIINNTRVEIDTSPPFESVKEAVDRFGGSGPWIPHHLLRLAAAHHHGTEAFDVAKMEEQAVQLERDLIVKEQQTLNVLKQLESAKRFVEGLKLNFMPELSSFLSSPDHKLENQSPSMMFMELNQAKSTLSKTSIDLAAIQSSIESLNTKIRKENALEHNHRVEVAKSPDIEMTISREINFEAEQFKSMTEASRYEVMKAMAEIERTKNSIKMAEMRLNAAKKMEEAAKAVEAIALAERRAHLDGQDSLPDGLITLSFEEYEALIHKAKLGQELCKTKFMDDRLEVPILEKFVEPTKENNSNEFGSNGSKEEAGREFRSTGSIGDLLTRKVVVQDDVMVERRVEDRSERGHVSLSQMLMEKSRLILHPRKQTSDNGNVERQYFVQRKKFGFIQVPISSKNSKKKTQPMNMR